MHSFVGRYEFNPNSDILDPNLNEACEPTWKNVTSTLAKHSLKLGWFGRPCNHIMQPDGLASASMTCPSKTIKKGTPVKCNLKNLTESCTKASMDTVDALIAKGVQNFYWDSYLCTGRMTFSQAITKKYPHAFIMGEQGIDVDVSTRCIGTLLATTSISASSSRSTTIASSSHRIVLILTMAIACLCSLLIATSVCLYRRAAVDGYESWRLGSVFRADEQRAADYRQPVGHRNRSGVRSGPKRQSHDIFSECVQVELADVSGAEYARRHFTTATATRQAAIRTSDSAARPVLQTAADERRQRAVAMEPVWQGHGMRQATGS